MIFGRSREVATVTVPLLSQWQLPLSRALERPAKRPPVSDATYNGSWIEAAAVCSAASVFLARTSGLDATHINAYTALICGLVADGIWTKLDVLHIYATQDSTTAVLNLVSTSYNGTSHGSPTFTADRGFTGTELSATIYIDTGFNPSTAGSPLFVLNSAHISSWQIDNTQLQTSSVGGYNTGPTAHTYILPYFTDNKAYFRINTTNANISDAVANTDSRGHFLGNRSASNATQGYINGSSVQSNSQGSTLVNNNLYTLGTNSAGTPGGTGHQVSMASIGSSLTSGEVTSFYNRLRTYMTAVGVP